MKKVFRYILGAILLLLFILFIDGSLVGLKDHIEKIKKWAIKQ